MRFKRLVSVFLSFCILLSLAGCNQNYISEKKPIVHMILKSQSSDFFTQMKSGAQTAANEFGAEIHFEAPENEDDYRTQNALIKRAVVQNADVILLSAIDENQSAEVVEDAQKSGVRVITVDSGVKSNAVEGFIGTDSEKAGKAAAKAALKIANDQEPLYIGLVTFREGTENGRQRENGFREFMKTHKNVHIFCVRADNTIDLAEDAARTLLKEHPNIRILVGFNEWMTLGLGNVLENPPKGISDLHGVGFDCNVRSISLVERGKMDALIVQSPFAMGYLSVKNAMHSELSKKNNTIYTDVTTVTRDNLFDSDIQKILFPF